MKKKKYEVNVKRFSKTMLCFFVVMFGIGFLFNIAFGNTVPGGKEYISVTVEPGDSLWKIASTYRADMDVRKKIDEIVQLNQLKDSVLQVNQTIKVPIE